MLFQAEGILDIITGP